MATVRITSDARAGYLKEVVFLAGSAGKLTVYTAPMPSTGGGAVGSAVQLGQILLADPMGTVAWNAGSSSHRLTFNASTPDTSADADGVAAWIRITDMSSAWVADFDVTASGGGGAFIISNTNIYNGGTISIASAVISLPLA